MVVMRQTWAEICAIFKEERRTAPLLKIAEYISTGTWKERLFGYIFLDNLVLCGYSAFGLFSFTLHIGFNEESRAFSCVWYERNEARWDTVVQEDKMMESFDDMISKVAWH